jgi:hypothetical protein
MTGCAVCFAVFVFVLVHDALTEWTRWRAKQADKGER